MASSSSSPILLMIIFSMWLLFSYSESTEYIAGDSETTWKVNFPSREALIDWATRHQFNYSDSVVKEDNCNTKIHSKLGDMVVKKRPLVLPPLITLPLSPSPAPSPNSSGSNGAAAGRGFVMWLGVSLAMMFLIWL